MTTPPAPRVKPLRSVVEVTEGCERCRPLLVVSAAAWGLWYTGLPDHVCQIGGLYFV